MRYYFLTLFPAIFHQYFSESMMKRAVDKGLLSYQVIDIRDVSENKHRQVDDFSSGGKMFNQQEGKKLSREDGIIFLCGHYEGIDARIVEAYVSEEYSVGDYVLTGGELPALTMADCIARHLSGFLGNSDSLSEESFENNLLEYPQYTRPPVFEGLNVPDILLSGNHKAIADWRQEQAELKTQKVRPDLYKKYQK